MLNTAVTAIYWNNSLYYSFEQWQPEKPDPYSAIQATA